MIEEAIKVVATAHAGLSALIATRLYWTDAPQLPTLPYIVCEKDNPRSVQGIHQNSGWAYTPVTFTVHAATALAAKQAMRQVRACFARYHGAVAIGGGTLNIDDVEDLDDGFDDYDHELDHYLEGLALEFFHDGAS